MGYNIIGDFSKKNIFEKDDNLISIQCQYAYQPYFREAFGCEITDWEGKLLQKDIPEFIEGLDKFINMLEDGLNVPMYRGYLGNISEDNLIKELTKLKNLVKNKKVRYLIIG